MDLDPQDAIKTTGGGAVGILMKVLKRFGISLTYSYLWHSPKVGFISEMKINRDLFCISLDLHYLCTQN